MRLQDWRIKMTQIEEIEKALEALLNYKQADAEGIMVLTSRQAIHEIADYIQTITAPQWQPIDSAPRDGTRILCFYSFAGGYDILEWDNEKNEWNDSRSGGWNPTHWMQLPTPPKENKND